jgi:hypothetical protein
MATRYKIATQDRAETFTNKTLTSPVISSISNTGVITVPTITGTLALTSQITGTNSGTNTGDETAARIATINHGTSAKTSLVDADEITGQDSAASFALIRTTWTNVKTFLKTYFDTLYATAAGTMTFTNKRNTKRVVSTTQSATPTINTDNGDIFQIAGLAQAITSMTTNLSGTPVAGDMIMIQITDNGTARAITWGASFASTTVTLPPTTVISTMVRVLLQRNNANTIWDCIGTA